MNIKDGKSICGRAEDLVAYLYGEASEIETKSFERHLAECGECRQELNAFGHARSVVESAREEAARTFSPLASDFLAAGQIRKTREKRSAAAAVREFFRLAPLWMQIGVAAASLAFCLFLTLAALHSEIRIGETRLALRQSTPERVVVEREVPTAGTYTPAQVEEMIKASVQKALADAAPANSQVTPVNWKPKNQRAARGSGQLAAKGNEAPPKHRAAAASQFAPEEEGPQLSDLLGEVK